MSRTRKNPDWLSHNSKPQWHGIKQAISDKLKSRIRDKDHYGNDPKNRHHAAILGSVICNLFYKGYSIEQIRKRLIGRWPTMVVDGYIAQCLKLGRHNKWNFSSSLRIEIKDLVCVSDDNYLIPLSTADCDPHLLININLPIYYQRRIEWSTKTGVDVYVSSWGDGPLVLMNERLYKFPSTRNNTKGNEAKHTKDQLRNNPLELWPQERITEIANRIADRYFESAMTKRKFEVLGWDGLSYTIDDNLL